MNNGRSDRGSPTSNDGWGANDGWGPATAVYGGAAAGQSRKPPRPRASQPAGAAQSRTTVHRPSHGAGVSSGASDPSWDAAGPVSRDQQRANRLMERQLRDMRTINRPPERGVRSWVALLVLIAIAVIGGLIDTVGGTTERGGFNIGIVVASVVAILITKRSQMFPIVIAPPIVYSLAAIFQLYLRSSGLHDKKVVLDAAANYLVYGFPAIATATAAVLIIAGARMILRK